MRCVDISGQKFGRLTAIRYQGRDKHRNALWLCICDCGVETVTTGNALRKGTTKSCGCLQREVAAQAMRDFNDSGNRVTNGHLIHGENKTPLHNTWCRMRYRCTNPNYEHYDRYGGRGISVCEEWDRNYTAFRDWAIENGYQPGLEIDRIDNDGNYEPGNCRWATREEQVMNRSNTVRIALDGVTKTLKEWCAERGVDYKTAHAKYKKGVPASEFLALTYIETKMEAV